MIFTVTVNYYNDNTTKLEANHLFVFADTLKDVAEKVSEYYGEDQIDLLEIVPYSPDDFIIFDEEDEHLFYEIKDCLCEKIIW